MTTNQAVVAALRSQRIELPSWAFGNSGTRFKVFAQKGVPRDPYEKVADAAQVNRFTGVAPTVALHIPWDTVDDYADLARHAADAGVGLGTINSNVFQDDDYMLGSVCNPDARVRRKALDHLLGMHRRHGRDRLARPEAVVLGRHQLPRPGRHPGPPGPPGRGARRRPRAARCRPADAARVQVLRAVVLHDGRPRLGDGLPAVRRGGHRRRGSSSTPATTRPGTNIEFIVASLLRADRLGGFDFNSRFYADDDLMVGSADPFQLFRIMHEVVQAGALDAALGVAFMLDQCHNIEPKIPGQIRSVMNVQEATAKALLVDAPALAAAQAAGDVLGANAVLMDAYDTDVRPLLAEVRTGLGLDPDPMAAYAPLRLRGDDRRRAGRRTARRAGAHELDAAATTDANEAVAALLERSNRLGADPRNTNYAGGNTSAKGTDVDPVTGAPVELLWVKGSGGDLGTLTEAGLAVLRLDRLRALVDVYPGVEREDEMVAAFDFCLHGRGGAAPSIDTAMHGLVDAGHVDHLHPDSGIALATAADGEALTRRCFGDRVAWVGWRRPGFQLGLDIAADPPRQPGRDRRDPRRPRHHGLGRHVRRVRGALARDHRDRRAVHRRARPARAVRARRLPATRPCPRPSATPARRPCCRSSAASPRPTGHRSATTPTARSCSTSSARAEHPRLAALGTSCPDHFLRTKVRPMVLDLPPSAELDDVVARLRELHAAYRDGVRRLLRPPRDARQPGRCAAPTRRSSSCRASGCSRSGRPSRPRGSRASSTSTRST